MNNLQKFIDELRDEQEKAKKRLALAMEVVKAYDDLNKAFSELIAKSESLLKDSAATPVDEQSKGIGYDYTKTLGC